MCSVLAQRLQRFRWLLIFAPHLGHTRDLRFIFSAVRGLVFMAVVVRVSDGKRFAAQR
jgi:hypothetical protein